MRLPIGPDQPARLARNGIIERADAQNHKRGQDIEVGGGKVWLTASDGSRWALVISAAGTVSAEDSSGTAGASAVPYSPGAVTIATETSKSFGKSLKLTGRLTVQGTGRARVVN